jgi:DNA processing protein
MTPLEAAGLATFGNNHRRLLATLMRAISGRSTDEDAGTLPTREASEPLLGWACRCGGARSSHTPSSLEREADRQLARAARQGIRAVPFGDPSYPPLLLAIPDPPPILWLRGQPTALLGPAIALVGSRAATPHGLMAARILARDLADAGVVVVSGLARGVDSAAHAAVLVARGATVGVLGSGVDCVYPPEHADLAREMECAGAIVSELPPGTAPLPHHFPLRNRLISGLAAAVVVVEAPERSGALITASTALEQGRDVFVVPGPITGSRNRGGHMLVRDGAQVVESAADILMEVLPAVRRPTGPNEGGDLRLPEVVDFAVEDVTALTGETPGAALSRLLSLELAGRVQRLGSGRFARL